MDYHAFISLNLLGFALSLKEVFVGYKHVKTDWRAFLPQTFSWLGEVNFSEEKAFEAGAAYVVPFEKSSAFKIGLCAKKSNTPTLLLLSM